MSRYIARFNGSDCAYLLSPDFDPANENGWVDAQTYYIKACRVNLSQAYTIEPTPEDSGWLKMMEEHHADS